MELPIIIESDVTDIKQMGMEWVENMLKSEITYTKAGSLKFLLHGRKPSEQSISTRMMRFGKFYNFIFVIN